MSAHKCRLNKDCPKGSVCDYSSSKCIEDDEFRTLQYIKFKNICLEKNMPLIYERGAKKGDLKPIVALKRCVYQKSRELINSGNTFGMPLPPIKPKSKR